MLELMKLPIAFFAMLHFYRDWYHLLVAFLPRLIIFRLADFILGVVFSKAVSSRLLIRTYR